MSSNLDTNRDDFTNCRADVTALTFERAKEVVQAAFGLWHAHKHDDVVLIEQQILGDLFEETHGR